MHPRVGSGISGSMDVDVVDRPVHRVRGDVVVQLFRLPWRRAGLAIREQIRRDAGRLVAKHAGALTWMEARGARCPRVLLACLGEVDGDAPVAGWAGSGGVMEQDDARRRAVRELGAAIERACDGLGLERIVLAPPPPGVDIDVLLEGISLRAHGSTEFAPQWQPSSVTQVTVCAHPDAHDRTRAAIERTSVLMEATNLARTLGDLPANVGRPRELSRRSCAAAKAVGLEARSVGAATLRKRGMGLLMGVAGGGDPPAVAVLEHGRAGRGRPTIALLGKGVTLDTGGYNLKTSPQMHLFTDDKAGAVAVVAAMVALARLQVDAHVIGMAPFVENVVSRAAYKPGDVLTAMDGTTVYVQSTDAEGRLVLADCLTWLQDRKPDAVIDLATLTGAAANALGDPFAAVYGNDDTLLSALQAAGRRTGELVWPMPVHPYHEASLVHPRAMIRNYTDEAGGAATAAAFLRRFAKFPWAHVDMAGRGSYAFEQAQMGAGATGWGTRLLVGTVERLAEDLPR